MKVYEGKRVCPTGVHVKDVVRVTIIAPGLIHYLCLTCEHEWDCSAVTPCT